MPEPKLDAYESDVLAAFEAGDLAPVADELEFAKLRSAATATVIEETRGGPPANERA